MKKMNQGRIPVDQEPFRRDDAADQAAGDEGVGESTPPNVTQTEPPSPAITTDADASSQTSQADGDAASLQRELSGLNDRYLRLAAEFDNYRRRSERERLDLWGRAQGDLARHLLDAIDDLERVAHHAPADVNVDMNAQAMLEGVQLIEKKLRQTLGVAGLEIIDAEGAPFDPNSMEAVAMVEAEGPDEDDVVSDVFQRGYRFKGTLLRPARVRVKKYQG
ncbi:MAG TPA: nucleotide exchange factor GrpE [Longimicrobiales bacterium]